MQCVYMAFYRLTNDFLTLCILGNFSGFCCGMLTFTLTLSQCQTVWTQIRTYVLTILGHKKSNQFITHLRNLRNGCYTNDGVESELP